MTAERVVDPRVDLAALHVALERLAQLRQRHVRARQLLEHQQRRDRAGVRAPVVAEVVVRGVLAAEDGAGLGHHLLDERVTDARAHRRAAVLADDLRDRVRADEVVDDRLARVAVEDRPWRRSRSSSNRSPAGRGRRRGRHDRRRRRTRARRRRRRRATARWRSLRFSTWIGSAGWFGNVPSSSPNSTSGRTAGLRTPSGTTRPPMPFAVSATTLSGRSTPRSTNERTCSPNSSSMSRCSTLPATSPR